MKDEANLLRRKLDRIGTRRGRCVPAELKSRTSVWIVARGAATKWRRSPRSSGSPPGRFFGIRSVTSVAEADVTAVGAYDSVQEDGRATEGECGGVAEAYRAVADGETTVPSG